MLFTGFYDIEPSFEKILRVISKKNLVVVHGYALYWVLLRLTEFYWVFVFFFGVDGIFSVLPGFIASLLGLSRWFDSFLLYFTEFYWMWIGWLVFFSGFTRVWFSYTWMFHRQCFFARMIRSWNFHSLDLAMFYRVFVCLFVCFFLNGNYAKLVKFQQTNVSPWLELMKIKRTTATGSACGHFFLAAENDPFFWSISPVFHSDFPVDG